MTTWPTKKKHKRSQEHYRNLSKDEKIKKRSYANK